MLPRLGLVRLVLWRLGFDHPCSFTLVHCYAFSSMLILVCNCPLFPQTKMNMDSVKKHNGWTWTDVHKASLTKPSLGKTPNWGLRQPVGILVFGDVPIPERTDRGPAEQGKCGAGFSISILWGFVYNFTNYTFRKPLIVWNKCLARGMHFNVSPN